MEMTKLEKLIVNNRLYNFLYIKFLLPRILNQVDRNIKGNVLDIGCGIGKTTKEIAKRFPNTAITAVDYDKEQIKIANKILPIEFKNRVKFLQGDGADLRFKSSSFDAVFEFNAFHHIKAYEKAMNEVYRILKNGCPFYILDVSSEFFKSIILKIDSAEALFMKNEFVKKLKNAGFKIEYVSRNEYFFAVKASKNA